MDETFAYRSLPPARQFPAGTDPARVEAEIRVGFMQGDGAWSYLGRQILDRGANERTIRRPGVGRDGCHDVVGHLR